MNFLIILLLIILCIIIGIYFYYHIREVKVGGNEKHHKYDYGCIFNNLDMNDMTSILETDLIDGGKANDKKDDKKASKKWWEYKTWEEMKKDTAATSEYLRTRKKAILEPSFTWDEVKKKVTPYLNEPFEYIGLINLKEDGKTLYVEHMERSSIKMGLQNDNVTMGAVPSSIVKRVEKCPALFIFHTHPIFPDTSAIPSARDLQHAIFCSTKQLYAGDVLISGYGIFVYGVDTDTNQTIKSAINPIESVMNYTLDVIMGYESTRSWMTYEYADIINLLKKYGMYFLAYINEAYVHDTRTMTFEQAPHNDVDLELIATCVEEIQNYKISSI